MLLLGTKPPDGEPMALGFIAQLCGSRGLDVSRADIQLVGDDSPEVQSHMGAPLPPLDAILADGVCGATLHQTAAASIEAALRDVRDELGAHIDLRWVDGTLAAVVRVRGREAVVLFPPEYPLGAPQVFSGSFARVRSRLCRSPMAGAASTPWWIPSPQRSGTPTGAARRRGGDAA